MLKYVYSQTNPYFPFNKQKKKKKKVPNRDPETWPDFSGWVGFQVVKPDFYRVGFRVTVNPTRPNISPKLNFVIFGKTQYFAT